MEKIIIPIQNGNARRILKRLRMTYPKLFDSAYVLGYEDESLFEDEVLLLIKSYRS